MAVLSGIRKDYNTEMDIGGGFVSEAEWNERIAVLTARLDALESGGTIESANNSAYDGGTPGTSNSGVFRIDFGGVS